MKKSGFTLIEILVVISITAILFTVGVASFRGAQTKGRDSIRQRDLNTFAVALEFYFQKSGKYISGVTTCETDPKTSVLYGDELKNYLTENPPTDPVSKNAYCYISTDGTSYTLCANLEDVTTAGTIKNACGSPDYNLALSSQQYLAHIASAPESPTGGATPNPSASSSPIPSSSPTPPPPAPICGSFVFGQYRDPITSAPPGSIIDVAPKLINWGLYGNDWTNVSKIEVESYPLPQEYALPFKKELWRRVGTITPQSYNRNCVTENGDGSCSYRGAYVSWCTPQYPGTYYVGMKVYDSSGKEVAGWDTDNPFNCTKRFTVTGAEGGGR